LAHSVPAVEETIGRRRSRLGEGARADTAAAGGVICRVEYGMTYEEVRAIDAPSANAARMLIGRAS
jgi:hypothetical protein